jgi:hypothetical protein
MMPHPSTMITVAELSRQDLLVSAQREQQAQFAVATLPQPPIPSGRWASVGKVVTGMPSLLGRTAEPLMGWCAALGRSMASRHGLPIGGS